MDEKPNTRLDVNTAGADELQTIPGVGPALAKRIAAARPFASLEELGRVKGVNADFAQRLSSYFNEIDAPAPPQEAVLPGSDGSQVISGPEVNEDPAAEASPAPTEPEPAETFQSRVQDFQEFVASQPEKLEAFVSSQPARLEKVKASTGLSSANLLTILAACLATMVLTILMMLALLGMINGGLRYASQSQFTALSRQVDASTSRLDMLEKDTESIRARLDALESLSGRMKLIEDENASLQKLLAENSRQVNEVRAQMEQTQASIEQLKTSTSFFNRVIDGLRSLLNETIQP